MGFVRSKLIVGDPERRRTKEIFFLADSGSYYTVILPSLASELGLEPFARRKLFTADKREVNAEIAAISIEGLAREAIVLASILDSPEPLLGAEALEALGLSVNPTTGELKPSRPYGLLL